MRRVGRSFRRRGVTLGAVALCLVAAAIVAAMVAAAVLSRQAADSHRRAQVLAEQLLASSQEMSALKWRVNTEVLKGTVDLSRSGANAREGARILGRLNAEATQLRQLQPGVDSQHLYDDVQQLIAGSISSLDLAQGITPQAKSTLAQLQKNFQPILDRMERDAGRAAAHEQTVAARALSNLQWVSIGSLLVGVLLLAALGWRLEALRRRSVLAEELREHERRSEQRTHELVEHSSDVITLLRPDLTIQWQAGSVRSLLGVEPGELIDKPITELTDPHDALRVATFLQARLGGTAPATLRTRLQHADGHWIHVEVVAANRLANPAIAGIVLNIRDASERFAFENELRDKAFRDPLTGLANRALFENRLRHALAAGLRSQRPVALLFLDLDDFKTINDSLGHTAGDLLLQRVSARIDPLVRPADTTARLGGDEFAVLLDGVESIEEAEHIAGRILRAFAEPMVIEQRPLEVTASIGIALGDSSIEADELLRNADTAMYAAKADGKNRVRAFEQRMHRTAVERLELRTALPRAIEDRELLLEYQPIVSLQAARVVGVEALVRWDHPTRGRLYPNHFIAVAEETGLIVSLGRWVLEEACAQVNAWHQVLDEAPLPYVSVNVSIRQLVEETFPASVAEILSATGLRPQSLVLEITEGLLADDHEAIVQRLHAFKRLGIRIAVDDFGTGYSSLSHLQHFPVDILKIDKSFIDELHTNTQTVSLVQGIINLGETLELDVVAEGIEKPEQAEWLKAMRSPLGQGFLFSRPTSSENVLELLRDPSRLPMSAG
jgi:diguanylate cyclase (GGDEF)-like protein/PAS domain S-box-containing protein